MTGFDYKINKLLNYEILILDFGRVTIKVIF